MHSEYKNATIILNPTSSDIEVTFDEKHTDVSFSLDSTSFTVPAKDARIYSVYKEIITNNIDPVSEDKIIKGLKIFPNPALAFINIRFNLLTDDFVSIEIINQYGQHVKTLNKFFSGRGEHEYEADVSKLKPGMYFIKLKTGFSLIYDKFVIR